MNQLKSTFILVVAIVLGGLLLSSCGGSSGNGSVGTTTINGISVPPEPDPAVNNAKLAGVDSNNNGVRDDVERYIAAKMAKWVGVSTDVAILTQSIVAGNAVDQNKRSSTFCQTFFSGRDYPEGDLLMKILNTPERLESYYKNYGSFPTPNCPK